MSGVAVIAQARMGSARLPGKVLATLGGRSVVSHVVRRAQAVDGVDRVCVATTADPADDPVAEEAARAGAEVFRGSETDVLGRYLGAARELDAELVMRVTCDCPLIDPEICAAVLRLRAERGADYACNVMPPLWPHGLDCEVFTMAALERAADEGTSPREREHVTPWMREHPDLLTLANLDGPGGGAVTQRWTLDYPEDLAFLEALFDLLPPEPAMPGWREIMEIVEANPGLAEINRRRIPPERQVA